MNLTNITTFLHALYGAKSKDLYILLWELERKRSNWFKNCAQAAQFAAAHAVNLYAGVAFSPADFGPRLRCKKEDVAGLVGLYADLDIAGPGHQSERLPLTESDALSLLPPEYPPSMIVDSGHGLQAWWLFKEHWIFSDGGDRARAQEITKAWDRCIRARATARGFDVDAVFDLARIMRVPGTINRKDGLPDVEARIMSLNEIRYNPSDFERMLELYPGSVPVKETKAKHTPPSTEIPGALPLETPQGVERVDPYQLLGWAVERVKSGKHRNRTGYDLCEQARDNRYSYSDAAALGPQYVNLVSSYGDHPYTLDEFTASLRQAYSHPAREPWALPGGESVDEAGAPEPSVISNVTVMPKQSATGVGGTVAPGDGDVDDDDENDDDQEDLEEEDDHATQPGSQDKTPQQKEHERHVARETVKRLLNLSVERVEKHGLVKGCYRMLLAGGRQFEIGDAKMLDSQTAFRVAVIDGLNQQIPRLTRKRWDVAVRALLGLVETIETTTPSETVAEELESYINAKGYFCNSLDEMREQPEEMLEWMEHAKQFCAPICELKKGGRVILSLRNFVAWVHQNSKTNLTSLEFANILSRIGFTKTSTIASATSCGKRIKLNRVWVAKLAALPIEVADERKRQFDWSGRGDSPHRKSEEAVM